MMSDDDDGLGKLLGEAKIVSNFTSAFDIDALLGVDNTGGVAPVEGDDEDESESESEESGMETD